MLIRSCFVAFLHLVSMSVPCEAQAQQIAGQVRFSWAKHPTEPGEWVLTQCDGRTCRHVGNFNESTKTYRTYTNGVWGPPDCAPCDLPAEVVERNKPKPQSPEPPEATPRLIGDKPPANFGIIIEEVPAGMSYRICNGKDCRSISKDECFQAIAGGGFPDDSGKPLLTIIGSDLSTKTVRADISSDDALRKQLEGWAVQILPPTSPLIKGLGFADGSPSIYLQGPDGKVLHRQAAYCGPEQLAEAARKADPKYDPKLDPDLTKPPEPPPAAPSGIELSILNKIPLWLYAVAAAAGVYVLFPRKTTA